VRQTLAFILVRLPVATTLGLMSISKLARLGRAADRMWRPRNVGRRWWVMAVGAASVAELAAAGLVLAGTRVGLILVPCLLLILSSYGAAALRHGCGCGCWGGRSTSSIPTLLARNGLLVLLAVGSGLLAPPTTLASAAAWAPILGFVPLTVILVLLALATVRLWLRPSAAGARARGFPAGDRDGSPAPGRWWTGDDETRPWSVPTARPTRVDAHRPGTGGFGPVADGSRGSQSGRYGRRETTS
jgi:hypothetical protein